jgi:hypothetical protein
MRQFHASSVSSFLAAFSLATLAGCGSSSDGPGSGGADGGGKPDGGGAAAITVLANPTASDGGSGINLSTYPISATMDPAGGSLTLPGGPTLSSAAGVLGGAVTIGMRPAATTPVIGITGYTLLSSWYDLATSAMKTVVASGAIVLDVPVSPPAEAVGQPGLQLLAFVNGVTLPLDGTYDPATGKFRVELLGLPPSFSFALGWNPGIQKLATDSPGSLLDILPGERDEVAVPWSTLDWWIVFDGNAVKMEQAKQVLAWARAASLTYSNAGLKEPFLRKETIGDKGRWYIHLTNDGSYFGEGAPADHGLFGRQYMSVDRIASPLTDPLGSGQASVAHEMFHAVFRAYKVPALLFCDTANSCQDSSDGFNEGMATAAGYFIDQGSPAKPRPNQVARPMWWPFGWFDPASASTMYMNQDFYVYLLRVGTLANFRMHLEALTQAVLTVNSNLLTVLNAYDAALDLGQTGFGGNFTQTWAWYAADRLYQRTPDGWLWPNEPAGSTPGTSYVLDASMLNADNNVTITDKDCAAGTNSLDCSVLLTKRYPLGPVVVSAKVDGLKLPTAITGKPLTGSFDAIVSGGTAAFTVFGEKAGKGGASAALRNTDGLSVSLDNVGTDYPTVRMVVAPSGSPSATLMVEMSFAAPAEAKVWILCEGAEGTTETLGCIGWDGDLTFTDTYDECLFAGYMTALGEHTTKAACVAACTQTASSSAFAAVCKTP